MDRLTVEQECDIYKAAFIKQSECFNSYLGFLCTHGMTVEPIPECVKAWNLHEAQQHKHTDDDPLGATPEGIKAHERRVRHITKSAKQSEHYCGGIILQDGDTKFCGRCSWKEQQPKQSEPTPQGFDYQATILGTGEQVTLHYPPETQ